MSTLLLGSPQKHAFHHLLSKGTHRAAAAASIAVALDRVDDDAIEVTVMPHWRVLARFTARIAPPKVKIKRLARTARDLAKVVGPGLPAKKANNRVEIANSTGKNRYMTVVRSHCRCDPRPKSSSISRYECSESGWDTHLFCSGVPERHHLLLASRANAARAVEVVRPLMR